MDLYILDENFITIAVVDTFESMIWTDRYDTFGDFELYLLPNPDILNTIGMGSYAQSQQSEHTMLIDEILITSDIESGKHLTSRGRSLEWILDRRIIWHQTILNGNFQEAILKLLNENIIAPTDPDRTIANFIFKPSLDPWITSLTINTQFTGQNLFETISELCQKNGIGFKIILNDLNQFEFSLYNGANRSYSQETNSYVVFSPEFDNLNNSNYLLSNRTFKTIALIAGEGEGADRRTVSVGFGSGLGRRELYVDARDIQSETDDGDIPDDQYYEQLRQRGYQKMTDHLTVRLFEGEVEATRMFTYDKDFFLGDIVQVVNEFDIEASARISEIVFSSNNTGNNIVPTFSIMP